MIKFTHQNGIFLTLVIKQKLLGAYFYIRKYLEHDLFIHFTISGYPYVEVFGKNLSLSLCNLVSEVWNRIVSLVEPY